MLLHKRLLKLIFLTLSLFNFVKSSVISDDLYDSLVESSEYSKICACISYKRNSQSPSHVKDRCNSKIDDLVSYKCSSESNFEIIKVLEHEFNYFGLFKFSNTGYIGIDTNKKRIILAFNGSKTWVDWLIDLTISLVPFRKLNLNSQTSENSEIIEQQYREICSTSKHCKVHKGFYHAAKSLFRSHESTISEFLNDNPDYQFWITGHSLGGAMALLSGLQYKLNNYNPIVITAGSPKVGNFYFNSLVNSVFNTYEKLDSLHSLSVNDLNNDGVYVRLIHKGDTVPSLPMGGYGYLYEHSGIALYINKKSLPHYIDDISVQNSNFQEEINIHNSETEEETEKVKDFYFEDDYENYSEFIRQYSTTDSEVKSQNGTMVSINKVPKVRRQAHANYFITVTSCKKK